MRPARVIIATLWILFLAVASIKIEAISGMRFNLCLAALVALSFFLAADEICFTGAWALLLLTAAPLPTLEGILYLALPFVALVVRHGFPLKRWLNAMGAAWIAVVIFSATVNYAFVAASPLWVALDASVGALVAGAVFQSMEWAYHEEHVRRMIGV